MLLINNFNYAYILILANPEQENNAVEENLQEENYEDNYEEPPEDHDEENNEEVKELPENFYDQGCL